MSEDQFELIPHAYEGEVIRQRSSDGYINATAMCKAAGREWSEYRRLKAAIEFMAALELDLGIPQVQLIVTKQGTPGGDARNQGTWIHPQIAIHLAQWASPQFAVKVSEWVVEWMSGKSPTDRVWRQFEARISLVYDRVPVGYFCIFKESADIIAALITGGVNVGTKIILDISIGQTWSAHWKAENLEAAFGSRMKYDHYYPRDFPQSLSNPQDAFCYPEDALPVFRRWMREHYIPTKLPPYLKGLVRDGKLLAPIANEAMEVLESHAKRRSLPRPHF